MLNIFLVLFLLLMVYWWSEQGLFSALLHTLVTVLACVIALALWEPLALGYLLEAMPDYAWGTALLLPFAVSLMVMRFVTDKFIPGNVDFPHLANRLGGAVLGFVSGSLTAGIVVIGLQMTGMPSFFEYEPWALDGRQQPVREQSLWVPVDDIAGEVFDRLSNGSFGPIRGVAPSSRYRKLSVEAGLYNSVSFASSRRAMRPEFLNLIEEAPLYTADELPPTLAENEDMSLGGGQQLVVVPTEVTLQAEAGPGAADADGNFRATPAQVALGYESEDGVGFAHPLGIIQRGDFAALTVSGTYATGLGDRVRFHWIFRVPSGAAPSFLRVKNARVGMPEERVEGAEAIERLITYDASSAPAEPEESDSQPRRGDDGNQRVVVSDSLPTSVARDILARRDANVEGDTLYSGEANLSDTGRPGQNLAVNKIHHPENARIVQLRMGSREPSSLLGQIMETATSETSAPVLFDHHGTRYFPIGYMASSGSSFRFSLDPSRSIRALSELDVGRVSEDENLMLIFQVEAGVRLTELRLGTRTEEIDVSVPQAE